MNSSSNNQERTSNPRWWLFLIVAAVAVMMLLLLPRHQKPSPNEITNAARAWNAGSQQDSSTPTLPATGPGKTPATNATRSAEEIVATKVMQFGRKRHELVRKIAQRTGKPVPPDVEAFFDAIEASNWDLIDARWKPLATNSGQYAYSTKASEELNPFWPSVLDAYGVAEQAHNWPAQKLLDYGNAVLDSLRPGMVYLGGTDEGRWIPTLLNESSDGDNHIVLTQNALADGRYLDFVNDLYGDRMKTLSHEESSKLFTDYVADAQKRFEHDRDFPDEPKQLRPGEKVEPTDGQWKVSGATAVMAMNEKLTQLLLQKNPDMSFALQESFPFTGTYADALPLGPLMELNARNDQNTFTPERAAQSVEYWRNTTQDLLTNANPAALEMPLRAASHNVDSTANLLASHGFNTDAEQAYKLASQLWPGSPEPIGGLAALYGRTGRADEGQKLLDDFAAKYPNQQTTAKDIWTARISTAPATPR